MEASASVAHTFKVLVIATQSMLMCNV